MATHALPNGPKAASALPKCRDLKRGFKNFAYEAPHGTSFQE